jgi:hypothetical protein
MENYIHVKIFIMWTFVISTLANEWAKILSSSPNHAQLRNLFPTNKANKKFGFGIWPLLNFIEHFKDLSLYFWIFSWKLAILWCFWNNWSLMFQEVFPFPYLICFLWLKGVWELDIPLMNHPLRLLFCLLGNGSFTFCLLFSPFFECFNLYLIGKVPSSYII